MRGGSFVVMFLVGIGTALADAGDPQAGKAKSEPCVACHGSTGVSAAGMYPHLAGQNEAYLARQLREFRDGARENAVMKPFVQNLSDQDVADLAAYYAAQTPAEGSTPEAHVAAGRKLYRAGDDQARVPACMACHGPAGGGNAFAGWPALSGQQPEYVSTQLKAYADGTRHNDPNGMMRDIAKRLSADDIEAISHYVSGLH